MKFNTKKIKLVEGIKEWKEVACKDVYDSDGFTTHYTWYTNGKKHIFMFGDKEIYTPDEEYADYYVEIYPGNETEADVEAQQWFDSYRGFEDELNESLNEEHCNVSKDLAFYVDEAIHHLIYDLGKDSDAEDFVDRVVADIENNYDNIDIPSDPIKYIDWFDSIACEVSRQLTTNPKYSQLNEAYNETRYEKSDFSVYYFGNDETLYDEMTNEDYLSDFRVEWFTEPGYYYVNAFGDDYIRNEYVNSKEDFEELCFGLDESLNEEHDVKHITLEVKFDPYARTTRFGYDSTIIAKVSGKDLRDALARMVDRMALYVTAESIRENPDYTVEEIIDDIASANGDGADFVYYIKDLTNNIMLFEEGYVPDEIEDWDDYLQENTKGDALLEDTASISGNAAVSRLQVCQQAAMQRLNGSNNLACVYGIDRLDGKGLVLDSTPDIVVRTPNDFIKLSDKYCVPGSGVSPIYYMCINSDATRAALAVKENDDDVSEAMKSEQPLNESVTDEYEEFQRIIYGSKRFEFEGTKLILTNYRTGHRIAIDLENITSDMFEELFVEDSDETDEEEF